MKLTFIGRGGAFAPISIGQSNMLFEENGKKMLLDCGMTAPYILDEMGIRAQDIDAIYVSHLHSDHIGGIEWLGFINYFTKSKKPQMFGAAPVLSDLWAHSLRGGMECIQGQLANLETFFDVYPVAQNEFFEWEGYRFIPVQTIHVVTGFTFQHSYGLIIQKESGPKTFISTDTQFTYPCPLQVYYDQSDIIFHDCETKFKSGVHSFYKDMLVLDEKTKAKMWLYHYNQREESEDGFAGWIEKGQIFNI